MSAPGLTLVSGGGAWCWGSRGVGTFAGIKFNRVLLWGVCAVLCGDDEGEGLCGSRNRVWTFLWVFVVFGGSRAVIMEAREEKEDGVWGSLKEQLEECHKVCLGVFIATLIGIG